ncbi:hypothetical protein CYMTET_24102, partial [Cymbomonas tetramitiformis]
MLRGMLGDEWNTFMQCSVHCRGGKCRMVAVRIHGRRGQGRKWCEEGELQDEWTPLYIAHEPHNEVVEALLAKGAQVDLADEDGRTPLYIAACNGRKEVVEALLAKGAQVDLAEQNEGTLLHIAACNGHKVVVEALLAKGAQVDLADKNGGTLLHIAALNGHNEVVEALLAKGAQVDLADKDGRTPL